MLDVKEILEKLDSGKIFVLQDIISIWKGRNTPIWQMTPIIYERLAELSIKIGEPLLACDIVREALKFSENERLMISYANASIQCGAYQAALGLLDKLSASSRTNFDFHILSGRVNKYIWMDNTGEADSISYFDRAIKHYETAYMLAKDMDDLPKITYAGINCATMHFVKGANRRAFTYVNEIIKICERTLEKKDGKDINCWAYATLGESHAILGNFDEARQYYALAVAKARTDLNSITTMQRQVRFILRHMKNDESMFDQIFRVPVVGCIIGHIVDGPESTIKRFPEKIVEKVRRKIQNIIVKSNVEIGFTSGAPGGDLLFAEEMIRRNNEVNLILPFPLDRYRTIIMQLIRNSGWLEKFDYIVAKASSITVLTDEIGTDDQAPFKFCNEIVKGMAALRAKAIGTELVNIAVWDERVIPDLRGTCETVNHWNRMGHNTSIISTRKLFNSSNNEVSSSLTAQLYNEINVRNRQDLVSILFADTVNYSRITDREIPLYVEHFVGLVADLIKRLKTRVLYKNTWGDALFLVFEKVEDAAEYSLALVEETSRIDWRHKGLPENIHYRIALHAGLAYSMRDPITEQDNYYGYHISKGARIEPITPPGQVYTSESFAALITTSGSKKYACDYVWQGAARERIWNISPLSLEESLLLLIL